MVLKPCNRNILIEIIEDETQNEDRDNSILLPEDYTPRQQFLLAKVIGKASDCKLKLIPGDTVLINSSMVEKVAIGDETYYLLLENHVLGVLQ